MDQYLQRRAFGPALESGPPLPLGWKDDGSGASKENRFSEREPTMQIIPIICLKRKSGQKQKRRWLPWESHLINGNTASHTDAHAKCWGTAAWGQGVPNNFTIFDVVVGFGAGVGNCTTVHILFPPAMHRGTDTPGASLAMRANSVNISPAIRSATSSGINSCRATMGQRSPITPPQTQTPQI